MRRFIGVESHQGGQTPHGPDAPEIETGQTPSGQTASQSGSLGDGGEYDHEFNTMTMQSVRPRPGDNLEANRTFLESYLSPNGAHSNAGLLVTGAICLDVVSRVAPPQHLVALSSPSFRALSGRLKFMVRRHKFNKYSLSSCRARP